MVFASEFRSIQVASCFFARARILVTTTRSGIYPTLAVVFKEDILPVKKKIRALTTVSLVLLFSSLVRTATKLKSRKQMSKNGQEQMN